MNFWGLAAEAWVIIIQMAATYAAVGSAYLLARPVMRNQLLDAHRDVLGSLSAANTPVDALVTRAKEILAAKARCGRKQTSWDNRWGYILLGISAALYTSAILLQVLATSAFSAEKH